MIILSSWVEMRVRVEMDGLHFRIVFGVNSSLVSVAISGLAGDHSLHSCVKIIRGCGNGL